MKITSIKAIEHVMPNSCSGTGYSEPDKMLVTWGDGKEKIVWVDIWYRTIDRISQEFKTGLREAGFILKNIENLDEAFKMYLENVAIHACPYSKKELFNYYNYNE